MRIEWSIRSTLGCLSICLKNVNLLLTGTKLAGILAVNLILELRKKPKRDPQLTETVLTMTILIHERTGEHHKTIVHPFPNPSTRTHQRDIYNK